MKLSDILGGGQNFVCTDIPDIHMYVELRGSIS